jgi:DNA-3-methyladenine glycosylase I
MSEFVAKYPDGLTRCYWPKQDQIYIDYHDTEWGVPVTDENALFEAIALEGFQAGLSWITILKRREGFRKAFLNFEIARVAKMTSKQVEKLMQDESIIRNLSKIQATIGNAKLVQSLDLSLKDLIWSHAPKLNRRTSPSRNFEFRAVSEESEALSKTLRSLGFSFVGPTTMYAMMQSIGMINDHAPGCFRRKQLSR